MKRVALYGGGRMGRQVAEALQQSTKAECVAVISPRKPEWLGGIPWCSGLEQLESTPDILVDFTLPGGTATAANWCRARLVALVSGTTGLVAEDLAALERASELVPVLWAPNLSRGVNILLRSVAETAASLPQDTPVEIIDVHHVHKKDAPSGTALSLARAIAAARGQVLEDCLHTQAPMPCTNLAPGSITCLSRREGEVIGEHRVRFVGEHEVVELAHLASDRKIYAQGALDAAAWLVSCEAGLYSAADWLNSAQSA